MPPNQWSSIINKRAPCVLNRGSGAAALGSADPASERQLKSSGKSSTPSGEGECLFSHIHSLGRSQTDVCQTQRGNKWSSADTRGEQHYRFPWN